MKLCRIHLYLAFASVSITSLVFTLRSEAADPATQPRPALVVTTGIAESVSWPMIIEASGIVAPWQEASVSSRSSTLPIVAIHVDVGDNVKQGQLLAQFDDSTVRAELARAEAALAQAQARGAEARLNRDRALKLEESGLLSKQDTLQATTNASATEAGVAEAQAMLQSARLALEHTRVLAPDAGVITSRSVTLGAVAQPGTELFKMIRRGRLEWRAELTASQLVQVRSGIKALVQTMDGGTVAGRVRSVAPSLDSASRTGLAYVDLDRSASIRASMYLKGELRLADRPAIVVPSASIVVRDGRTFIAALDGNRVRLMAVVTGRRVGERTEVTSGVAVGQVVVVRGAGFLNDRDIVRVATGS